MIPKRLPSLFWLFFALAQLIVRAGSAQTAQAPNILRFSVNDGAEQRSLVTSIAITFSVDVGSSLQAADLHITNLTQNAPVTGGQFQYNSSNMTGTWTFPDKPGRSLPDGNYLVFIHPADVVGPSGLQLLSNSSATNWSQKFFRYFGDFDGDRDVDNLDAAKMRRTDMTAPPNRNYNPLADVNGDGRVDDTDLAAFNAHYLSVLPGDVTTPVVIGAPVRTSQQTVTISGKATPASRIVITNGFYTFEGMTDENGNFSIKVGLLSNRINSLFISGDGLTPADVSSLVPVTITQDSTPPFLYVDSPTNDSTVDTASVTVTGRVGDLLSGFQGLSVKVNQIEANVIAGIGPNGTFEAPDVPLAIGENFLAVVATDALGTAITKSVTITRVAQLQMEIVSGNDQIGTRNTELSLPLVVKIKDGDGKPFVSKVVNFQVTRSDGHTAATKSKTTIAGPMMTQARTDTQGLAKIYWRIGSDAGKSNNLVVATSAGVPGQAQFRASAVPQQPTQINVGMGNNQVGEAGGLAPLPLTAWVSDNLNGSADIPVTFVVTSGDARVAAKGSTNASASITIPSDSTGHVEAYLHYGESGGTVAVEARFEGLKGNPAVFLSRALVRKPSVVASFSGVVQDNSGLAIGGVTCTLNVNGVKLPSVVSDIDGSFLIENASTGAGFIQIDGRTANKLGGKSLNQPDRFPSLVYRITVVPNTNNPLPTIAYLPTLNPVNSRIYDGTKDVDLSIQGIEGLKMTIKSGAMTLADGTKPTAAKPVTISLNQVHTDNIPMPIQDGVAPILTWTLQPPGAHFDPPVAIQYPNMTGLRAGATTNFLSYNHDVERFEIVASGTVSADGSVINTDPGTGLLNSGWGCNCPPYAATGECATCKVEIVSKPPDPTCQDQLAQFSAVGTPAGGTYKWTSDGKSGGGDRFSVKWSNEGVHTVSVEYTCQTNGKAATSSTSVAVTSMKPGAVSAFQVDLNGPVQLTQKFGDVLSRIGIGEFSAEGSVGFGGQKFLICCKEDGHLAKKYSGSLDLKAKVKLEGKVPIPGLSLPLPSPWDIGLNAYASGELAASAVGTLGYDQCDSRWVGSASGNIQAKVEGGVKFDALGYVTISGGLQVSVTGYVKVTSSDNLTTSGNVKHNGLIVFIKATYESPITGNKGSISDSYVLIQPADVGNFSGITATSL